MSSRLQRLSHVACVVVGYASLYVAFFAPVIFTGRLLAPGDACFVGVPHFQSHISTWSPWIFAGFPTMGDPQTMTWYPVAWLIRAVFGSWNLFVVMAYVLASSFTYGYVHSLTRKPSAAAVSGLVYGLSGFLMAHLGHTNIVHSAAWLPLLIWSLEKLHQRVTAAWVVAGALAVTNSVLAGQPQFAAYSLAVGTCYAAWLAWRAGHWPPLGAAVGAMVLGLAGSAVLTLPMVELQAQGLRPALSFQAFAGYNLPLRQLPQLFLPYLFGGFVNPFTGGVLPGIDRGGGLTEATGYVGLLPLLLVLAGMPSLRRSPVWRFWLLVAGVTLVLALGKETLLCRVAYSVPVFNRFRIPARHLMEFSFAMATLAGLGVSALARMDHATRDRAVRRATAGILGAIGLALCSFCVLHGSGRYFRDLPPGFHHDWYWPWRNPGIAIQGAVFVAALGALLAWSRKPCAWRTSVLAIAVAADLGAFGWFYEWQYLRVPTSWFVVPDAVAHYRDELIASGQRLMPLCAFGPSESAPPNRSQAWHVPSALGHSPLVLRRYSEALEITSGGFFARDCLNSDNRMLDLLATRYVLVPPREAQISCDRVPDTAWHGLEDRSRWNRLSDLKGGTAVFENRRALPRAWLVPRIFSMGAAEVLRSLHHSALPNGAAFDPRQVALVEDGDDWESIKGDPEGEVRHVECSETTVDIDVVSAAPAFLVLSDTYYDGWSATVNGAPQRIYRTDYVLRGVFVPAGASRVHFSFQPLSFAVGAVSSGAAAIVALGLLVAPYAIGLWCRRKSRTGDAEFDCTLTACASAACEQTEPVIA